ncbi:MAG: hypothetical protein HY905_07530 [Deltaproteobacteria bacterium]|nr:hypothetical protein [Deltaproteobacteria bacterium]
MRIFLDTIEEGALGELWPTGAFAGVTTNPLILARARTTAEQAVERCRRLGVGQLFLQAASGDVETIVRDGRRLAGLWRWDLWVKVPAYGDGFAAMARLRDVRVRTAATAILTMGQALLAAEAGADVLIPFVGRAASSGLDAAKLLADVCRVGRDAEARVLAASVKDEDQLRLALEVGCWGATILPELAAILFRPAVAEPIVARFRDAESSAEE